MNSGGLLDCGVLKFKEGRITVDADIAPEQIRWDTKAEKKH